MERKIESSAIVEIIGEYGIIKAKESVFFYSGELCRRYVVYDVCLDCGNGDIVASFNSIKDARKWVKEELK